MIARRSLLRAMIAAPFIVKASSLMPVRSFALDLASPPDMAFTDWIVISGIDQYGRQHSEKFRYIDGGWHVTTIKWQSIDNISHVGGSFSRVSSATSLDRVDSGYDL